APIRGRIRSRSCEERKFECVRVDWHTFPVLQHFDNAANVVKVTVCQEYRYRFGTFSKAFFGNFNQLTAGAGHSCVHNSPLPARCPEKDHIDDLVCIIKHIVPNLPEVSRMD